MKFLSFQEKIQQGIPNYLPEKKELDPSINRAPKRKHNLSIEEKKLAIRNALRYFPKEFHEILAKEFYEELEEFGHIYMYRYIPDYEMFARPINEYPAKCISAAAIMHMIQNNLDPEVAQHPYELITYGGNGSVFQNWAQYLLTMKYLSILEEDQTLVIYSGHPLGIFPSNKRAPRVIITNGMVIPNYSSKEHYEKFYALGVTQYGQMTAGSYMYIGPQGIVHGTTITILNAARLKTKKQQSEFPGMLFVSSGLGGMSGAQAKAATIAGMVGVIAEVNIKPINIRYKQGWVNEVYNNLDKLIKRIKEAVEKKEAISLAYHGNVVDLWEKLIEENINVDIGSDQTSLHNPFNGGYYPVGLTFEEANELMVKNPSLFKEKVYESLRRQVKAINILSSRGMYFFDYGNAFLLEASRAGADILNADGSFKYPSYVQDIMGPLCFDYGFGPFRWICTSANEDDLKITDEIAGEILDKLATTAPSEIKQQLNDNIKWIKEAQKYNLVVGSKARILYSNAEGRILISKAFNDAIRKKYIKAPIVLGRDHHDVSGTDSPYRETSNIYDGSKFTADMAVHTFVGNAIRGATWVALHNGGGVGWGESINGGFGLVLDGSIEADINIEEMLFWDVCNGIARRAWAGNPNALQTIKYILDKHKNLIFTMPNFIDSELLNSLINK